MANKIFSSYNSSKSKDTANDILIVEAGTRHLACMIKGGSKQAVRDFELFKVETEGAVDYRAFFNNCIQDSSILTGTYSEILLYINNEYSVLVPSASFNSDSSADYLNIVHGDNYSGQVYQDAVNETDIMNLYRIPVDLLQEANHHLKGNSLSHSYSKIISNIVRDNFFANFLKVSFYEGFIIVVLLKDKKLNIIQSFTYQTPEDVLYYLLSIAQRFQLNGDQVHLQLTGMFNSSSSFTAELRKFYKHVSTEDVDTGLAQLNLGDYPKHYFTPFFNLAK